MKRLRNLVAVLAMMSIAGVFTGCGDDDDDAADDDFEGAPPAMAPSDPTSPNNTYTATVAGQSDPITLTFPSAGNYQMVQGGVTEIGTISAFSRTDNTLTMNVTPAAGQEGTQEGVLRLDFTAENAGTWTFTPTGGQAETGTFILTIGPNIPDDPDPGPAPIENTLTGRTLQINYSNGGGERFDFITDTTVSYESGAEAGTYTWDSTNRILRVTLNNGWRYEITIPVGVHTGTVVFRQNDTATPTTDPVTYTLQ